MPRPAAPPGSCAPRRRSPGTCSTKRQDESGHGQLPAAPSGSCTSRGRCPAAMQGPAVAQKGAAEGARLLAIGTNVHTPASTAACRRLLPRPHPAMPRAVHQAAPSRISSAGQPTRVKADAAGHTRAGLSPHRRATLQSYAVELRRVAGSPLALRHRLLRSQHVHPGLLVGPAKLHGRVGGRNVGVEGVALKLGEHVAAGEGGEAGPG